MLNPMQVARNNEARRRKERQQALDEVLLRGVRPSYSTWTGKAPRPEPIEATTAKEN